ncbi:MAG: M23 family metallopeptidase [Candidatus Cloacimonetes bacterium]|jgi:murein DD-endopeptidase MepM/ murein hydrolase activator NlpD|nr:M23 family metallopeptidase [Candidatus Cloacimonadota bacterium]MBT6993508.1 M23 family metallopeptidase [Candidatus Cloacimonadota bacterium]MBT7469096.1 M23 family metallopeptidase [Candidatus Cloacimonadota bacterium]
MKNTVKIHLTLYGLLIILLIITTAFIIDLNKKLDYLKIITIDEKNGNSLKIMAGKKISTRTILLTPQMIDTFNKYKSPFNDNFTFDELIKKYINNKYTDHYGVKRGSAKCRRIHEGIDLFVPRKTPIYPLTDYGIVTEVSNNEKYLVKVECKKPDGSIEIKNIEYGKTIRILYPEGIESIYTHLDSVFVELNQVVNGNTKVGLTGLTGNIKNSGKASHLHLELRDLNNKSFDPRHKLRFNKPSIQYFLDKLDIE